MRKIIRILFLVTMLITVSCNSKKVENNIVEVPKESKVIKVDKTGTFEYELNNLNGEDVYFIFTNESDSSISAPTIVKTLSTDVITKKMEVSSSRIELPKLLESGSAEITESNWNIGKEIKSFKNKDIAKNRNNAVPSKILEMGAKENFFGGKEEIVPATLRRVQNAHGKELYIWVADDSWHNGGIKATKINQSMVDILADKFLKEGLNNDIYEWVSNIVGEPWGNTVYEELIGDDGSIHILLYDINNDNSTDGGTCGYFWSKHNVKKSVGGFYSTSNEKLMFAIDSVLFAKEEGSTWEIVDYWPQFMVSTLAHEFQHMINFYQKDVLRDSDSSPWINELSSMAIEDLVARKILADGPRGVNYNNATAGSPSNGQGRIPTYNRFNNKSIIDWTQDPESYSMSYTFGAYLMRNYGGAKFIRNLVLNDKDSVASVEEALKLSGYDLNFNVVLRNFAIANLLSDNVNNQLGYNFNTSSWLSSSINGINYDLGGINLYNYKYTPKVYNIMPLTLNGIANTYYNAGKALKGTNKWTIKGLDSSIKMTVVTKK